MTQEHSPEAQLTGLPLFDDETPLDYAPGADKDIFSQLPPHRITALRRVHMWGPHFDVRAPLRESLAEADETLENAAQHAAALVVKHTWGLRREREDDPNDPVFRKRANTEHNLFTPRGYILVAEVEVIDDAQPINELKRIREGLQKHRDDNNAPARWLDARTDNFVTGTSRVSGAEGTWLVDIEPCLLIRPQHFLELARKQQGSKELA